MKNYKWLILGMTIFGFIVIAGIMRRNQYSGQHDFRLAILNEDGISLKTVSRERRMVNTLDIGSDVEVWIPKGLGWYRSGKVVGVLTQEKKLDLASDVLFFNFGFIPDVIVSDRSDNWLTNREIINSWGWYNYFVYRITGGSMMKRLAVVKGDYPSSIEYLNEAAQRDFADSRLLREDIRISIYNASFAGGMASFVARNLEWAGLTVVGIETLTEKIDKCQVRYGSKVGKSFGYEVLKHRFFDCDWLLDDKLGTMEVELYFGDSYAQMLNYQSYKKDN